MSDETGDPTPEYNTVFERLVEDPKDEQLVGLVAYSVYKFSKREWVRNHRKRYGTDPGPDDYRAHAEAQTDETLKNYRSRAADMIGNYANELVEKQCPRILKDALQGSFWRSFWPSFVASIAFALLLAVLVLIALAQGWALPFPIAPTGGR